MPEPNRRFGGSGPDQIGTVVLDGPIDRMKAVIRKMTAFNATPACAPAVIDDARVKRTHPAQCVSAHRAAAEQAPRWVRR